VQICYFFYLYSIYRVRVIVNKKKFKATIAIKNSKNFSFNIFISLFYKFLNFFSIYFQRQFSLVNIKELQSYNNYKTIKTILLKVNIVEA
jgi:hypothetical protein